MVIFTLRTFLAPFFHPLIFALHTYTLQYTQKGQISVADSSQISWTLQSFFVLTILVHFDLRFSFFFQNKSLKTQILSYLIIFRRGEKNFNILSRTYIIQLYIFLLLHHESRTLMLKSLSMYTVVC